MAEENVNYRLETFSDAVFAIALTLLIIDIKVPPSASITNTADLWLELKHTLPSVFAFLLSFGIILITWVNHHATFKLVSKSSHPFIYANGFFLLTVVILPFPTALLGEYLSTDHSSPAVVIYCGVCGFQAIGWNILTITALKLTKNEKSALEMRRNHKYSYFAFAVYTICAIAAFWFPLTIAIIITVIWIIWLIRSITFKGE